MKKKLFSNYPYWSSGCKKLLLTMKIGFILTLFCVIQLQASLYSQSTKFNLNFNNTPLREILREVENKSDFRFFYSDDLRFLNNKVTLKVNDSNVEQILDMLLVDSHLTYKVFEDNLIIITPLEQPGQRRITGKVTDAETGEAIPGANIVIEGTTIGTITSLSGEYSIEVPGPDAVLVISFIGYMTQKIPVNDLSVIDVNLPVDFAKIEEVVVTALGLEKSRRTLTYSTQQLDMDNMTTLKDKTLGNALAGKVAGLSVITSSGSLGVAGDARIILRGDRSINGNNQPLIVIDGIPVSDRPSAYADIISRTIEGASAPGGYRMNSLSVVNTDDIESINVLKGPAASALYGSSAQNGVIVITTKKGRAGKSTFEINSLSNFDLPYLYPEFQDEYGQGRGGAFIPNSEIFSWGPKMTGQTVTDWTGKQSKLEPQPNNVKDMFRIGQTYTNTISYSTGVERATAYFSYSNTSAMGLLKTNNMQRHNFNLRVTSEVTKKLHADFKITYFNPLVSG